MFVVLGTGWGLCPAPKGTLTSMASPQLEHALGFTIPGAKRLQDRCLKSAERASSQGMRDISCLALLKSHQETSHDAGIQGTACCPLTWDSQQDSSGLERGLLSASPQGWGQSDQILAWQGLSLQTLCVSKTAPPLLASESLTALLPQTWVTVE